MGPSLSWVTHLQVKHLLVTDAADVWEVEWSQASEVVQLMTLQGPHGQHDLPLLCPPAGAAEPLLAVVKPRSKGRRDPV